ncbi:MAG: MltA domain-containing protein [Desulforhopalus sp.]
MVFRSRPFAVFALLLSVCLVAGVYTLTTRDSYKPIHRLSQQDLPEFSDDLDIDSLIECAKRQVAYLQRQDPESRTSFGADTYDNRWLLLSIREFLAKLEQHPDKKELNRFLQEKYLVYQAGGRTNKKGRRMLVTGYYEPVFEGSLTKEAPFLTPVYSPPDSLVVIADSKKSNKVGRYDTGNQFVAYWTRAEIENEKLLEGYELAFLKDPFDAFLLHVQGSGRIQLPDSSIRSIRFAGSNGLEYNSIGKLLVDEGTMALAEVSIPAIRAYLLRHPKERKRILHHNPRFIFFSWGNTLAPTGSSGEPLTPGRSIAMDSTALPGGTIGYLVSRKPVVQSGGTIADWVPLNRFVFPQDSGAAIKGTGRVDMFWGNGNYAEVAANHMKEDGSLYFLVKKGYPGANSAERLNTQE